MMNEEPIRHTRTTTSFWSMMRWPLTVCLSAALLAALLVKYGDGDSGTVTFTTSEFETVTDRHGFLPDGRIDLNSASYELLLTLPGIGEERSASLVAARGGGPFTSIENLAVRSEIPLSVITALTHLAGLE
jgi:DNA uptake protein ComE-like DNA-binding protein